MTAPSLRSRFSVPGLLRALSAALVLLVGAEISALAWIEGLSVAASVVFSRDFLVGVLTMTPFIVGVAYAGYWLEQSAIEESRYPRVWQWTLVGTALWVLTNLVLMTVIPVTSLIMAVAWLRWAVAIGAGVGAAIGVTEARAIQQAMEAERSAVRAEHLEVQRDLLDYLNSLLRHEVLNASNVISGYAELLRDEHDPGTPGYEYSETIHRKSEEVTRVVQDVRVLLHATEERTNFERVDVAAVVREEAAKLSDLDEDVVVETDLPDTAYVHTDALLPRVFGNVLANAVQHNDSDPVRVWVRGSVGDDAVTIEVEDNGPGIPDDEVSTLFERPSRRSADHGLGLYLVQRLLDHYCGNIELAETGPEGSTFRIVLPQEPPVETTGSPFIDPGGDHRNDPAVASDGAGQ